MKRTAIYARFSSDNQRQESITAQFRAIKAYCEKKQYLVVKEYTDEAESGKTDDRPAFQQMVRDAKGGLFDIVVFHKIDRNARNEYDYYYYKRLLKKAGVSIEYADQQFDDSPEGKMLEAVMVGVSAFYSRNLAREVIKGMRENAYKSKHNGGTPALGYDVIDGEYVINESEAAIVRLIFSKRAEGASLGEIIKELSSRGCTTKRGKPFGKNSITDLLRNEKYIGNYIFGRGITYEDGTRSSRAGKNVIKIENAIPPIVDMETWGKVQGLITTRAVSPVNKHRNYLLTGVIKCQCGAAMVGTTTTTRGVPHYYYKCNTYQRLALVGTGHERVRAEKVEHAVMEELTVKIAENKNELIDAYMDAQAKVGSGHDYELVDLTKRLKDKESKIDNLLNAIAAGVNPEAIKKKVDDLTTEKELIIARIHEIGLISEQSFLTREQIRKVLEHLESYANKKEKWPEIQPLIKLMVSVVVCKEEFQICIKLAQYWCGWSDSNRHDCEVEGF